MSVVRQVLTAVQALFAAGVLCLTASCASPTSYAGVSLIPGEADPELQALASRAQSGSKHAQLELGIRYEEGVGVPIDLERAKAMYRRASEDVPLHQTVYVPDGSGAVVPDSSFLGVRSGLPDAAMLLFLLEGRDEAPPAIDFKWPSERDVKGGQLPNAVAIVKFCASSAASVACDDPRLPVLDRLARLEQFYHRCRDGSYRRTGRRSLDYLRYRCAVTKPIGELSVARGRELNQMIWQTWLLFARDSGQPLLQSELESSFSDLGLKKIGQRYGHSDPFLSEFLRPYTSLLYDYLRYTRAKSRSSSVFGILNWRRLCFQLARENALSDPDNGTEKVMCEYIDPNSVNGDSIE